MVLILESGPIPPLRWRWQWLLGGLVRLGGETMVTWAMQDNQPWGNCQSGMSVLKTFWPTSYMTAGSSPFTRCKLTSCLKRLDQLNSGKTEQQGVSPAVLIFCCWEVPRIIELAADCVCALYERASVPDVSASETDRCGRHVLRICGGWGATCCHPSTKPTVRVGEGYRWWNPGLRWQSGSNVTPKSFTEH